MAINNTSSNPDLERAVAALALEHNLMTPAVAARIIRNSRDGSGRGILSALLDAVPETTVLAAVAKELKIPYYDLYSTTLDLRLDEEVIARADMNALKRYNALPMVDRENRIVVVVANPGNPDITEYLKSRYSNKFSLVIASRLQIQNRLTYYSADAVSAPSTSSSPQGGPQRILGAPPKDAGGGSNTQAWVDSTLARAAAEGASDVHFLFNADKTMLLRFRVDGLLRQQRVPVHIKPMEIIGTIVSRCEAMDASNYRIPQDGTFSFEAAGRQIDARVGMLPQASGPTLVIRLLDSNNMRTRLDDMGFSAEQLKQIRAAVDSSQGTVLVCGPTGAGKSTTLYGLLREVDSISKSVYTVENPVEYRLPFIGQTEIRNDLGERSLTFAKSLRSILRLDPDIILVGEIRDAETAEVAMQAAITGHLVLSTTHANSALGAYTRLTNMKVPSYLVAEAISLVIAQRLLRRVHDCARIDEPTPEEVAALRSAGLEAPKTVAHPVGCPGCNGTGYRGRMAVVEVLSPTREIRTMVAASAPRDLLLDEATKNGFQPLLLDGLRQLANHKTTVSEMMRVLAFEDN